MKLIGPNGEVKVELPSQVELYQVPDGASSLLVDGEVIHPFVVRDGLNVWVAWNGYSAMFTLPEQDEALAKLELRAPMTGKVVSISVAVGDSVEPGQTVATLEAMKMEYRLEAEVEGKVAEIGAKPGELVDLGQLLVRLE